MPHLHRVRILAAAAALTLASTGVAVDAGVVQAAKKKKHKVTIKGTDVTNYRFKPKTITIKKGQTVHWSWNSNAPHNVTFGAKRHSTTAQKVSDFKLKFKKKGTFQYSCTVHGFTGSVVVK